MGHPYTSHCCLLLNFSNWSNRPSAPVRFALLYVRSRVAGAPGYLLTAPSAVEFVFFPADAGFLLLCPQVA